MPHTGSSNGELQYRQITGQKQQSGGCNLGAVANALAASLLLSTAIMLECWLKTLTGSYVYGVAVSHDAK